MEDLLSDTNTPVESSSDEEQETGNSNVVSFECQNVQLSKTDFSDDEALSECKEKLEEENNLQHYSNIFEVGRPISPAFRGKSKKMKRSPTGLRLRTS
jgi:hypothetical protein